MILNNTNKKICDFISTAVLIFTIAVIPLIVHLKMIPVDQEALNFWNSSTNGDFFSYYKSICICGAALLITILMIMKKVSLKQLPHFIPVGIIVVGIILSALLSLHPYTSIHGFPDRYEGVLVLLSYLVLFIGASTLIDNSKQMRAIIISLLVSAAVIGTIGLLQYLGYDFFQTAVGRYLVDPSQVNFTVTVNQKSNIGTASYGSLYNPNAFGMYMTMLFPFTLFMSLFATSRPQKLLLTLLTCLLFAALLGSLSRGSLVAAGGAVLITALLVRKRLFIHWKQAAGLIVLCAVVYVVMNVVGTGALGNRVESLAAIDQVHLEDQQIDKVKDFNINGPKLTLYCTKSVLKVVKIDSNLSFFDNNDREFKTYVDNTDGTLKLADDRYKNFSIMFTGSLLKIQKGKSFLYFRVVDNTFVLLNAMGEIAELKPVPKFGFKGLERIGSGRGYIWSRSLPMLSQTLFIGKGPDTFTLEFPQYDYIGKLKYMYDAYLIVDKPHNMYLQSAINTGILSLLVMLMIFGLYISKSAKLLLRRKLDDYYSATAISIFAAVIGYLLAGLFTDSTVSVAPVFWLLLGLGFSINARVNYVLKTG